jgi:pimeloyl-ACP methyl ester carboxylesterase
MNAESSPGSVLDGQPVVLIHGLGASKRDWEGLSPILRAKGFTPLSPDLVGHGENAKPEDPSEYHISMIFMGFEEWLRTQTIQQRLSLVGHSIGGYIALRFALDYPDRVRSLVLVDPFYKSGQLTLPMRSVHRRPGLSSRVLEKIPYWLMKIVLAQMPRGGARFTWDVRERIASDLKRASPHILNVSATLPDLEAELPSVSVPTLVVWGQGDLTLRPRSFHTLVELMPNAVAHPFAKCGHQPHLAQPEVFNRLVADFLTSTH